MNRRQTLLSLAAGAALLALAPQAGAQAPGDTPRPGGTLRFVMKYEPPTLSSINNTSTPLTSGKIFDGLVTYDFDLNPKAQLATSWTVSPDGLKYVFKLREGVTWHDGKPFTSADAAFSILRLKAGHPRGRATFANVEQANTPDPLTLELILSKPAPFLMVALGPSESPIVPKHLYEGVDVATPPGPALLIGTGPFVLKEWNRGSHVVLERNPNYWDKPKPYLDRVVIRFGDQELYPAPAGPAELDALTAYLHGDEVRIHVSLHTGDAAATVWGCDLTDGYVRINADYTT
jgi:peptide/nickel transport system substrate-binding protein